MLDPQQLINIISSCTENEIDSELCMLSAAQRNQKLTSLTPAELQERKQLFTYARLFIKSHPQPLMVNSEQLSNWFVETTDIEDNEKLAMHCWYAHINNILPRKLAKVSITLGLAYLMEPHKFAAFLYWLLENDVTPRKITKTDLLYRFFSYHIIDIAQLQKTYALLENLSDSVTLFLDHIETTSCQQRGFVDKEENEQLRSYNVKGGTFLHEENLLFRENVIQKELSTTCFFQGYGAALFDLFGWEFIRALDLNHDVHKSLLIEILKNPICKQLLEKLPCSTLEGETNANTTEIILRSISTTLGNRLDSIIQAEPFYVHLNWITQNQLRVDDSVKRILAEAKYKTIHHIPFLVNLSKHLREYGGLSLQANQILALIFELILPYGNTLADEIADMIEPVKELLEKYCEAKFIEYSQTLHDTISQFIKDETDYSAVELLWGSTLSQVNLFNYLYPELKNKICYPFNKYDLKGEIVLNYFLNKSKKLSLILNKICDLDNRRYTVQEILVKNSHAELEKALLNWIDKYDSPDETLQKPFDKCESVILHAIANYKSSLFLNAAKIVSFSKNQLTTALLAAIKYKNIPAIQFLCEQDSTSANVIDKVVQTILKRSDLSFLPRCDLLQTLYTHCDKNKLSKNTMCSLFYEAVDNSRDHFISLLCLQRGCNRLSKYVIAQGAKKAVENENWGLLQFLCGLSNNTSPDDPVIRKNNIYLYVRLLQEKRRTTGFYALALKEPLNIINNSGENILHIAAANQNYKAFQNLFELIEMLFSGSEIAALIQKKNNDGKIPFRDGDSRNAQHINRYLERARSRYVNHPSFLLGFFRQRHNNNNQDIFDLLDYPMRSNPGSSS